MTKAKTPTKTATATAAAKAADKVTANPTKPGPVQTIEAHYPPGVQLTSVHPEKLLIADQVRKESRNDADAELIESIKMHGVLQPILCRKLPDGSLLVIAGHRRRAAAIAAGLQSVPVAITAANEGAGRVLSLTENLQRLDMSITDTAEAVCQVYETEAGGSTSVTAELLGKPLAWVSKFLMIGHEGFDKANKAARSLMAAGLIEDLDTAYTLCQVEKRDPAVAETIRKAFVNADEDRRKREEAARDGKVIGGDPLQPPTRAMIRQHLEALKRGPQATDAAEVASQEADDEGDPSPGATERPEVQPVHTPKAKLSRPLTDAETLLIRELLAVAKVRKDQVATLEALRKLF